MQSPWDGRSRVAAISAGVFDVFVLSSGVNCHGSFKDGKASIYKERGLGLKFSRGPDPCSFHSGIAQISAMALSAMTMGLEL